MCQVLGPRLRGEDGTGRWRDFLILILSPSKDEDAPSLSSAFPAKAGIQIFESKLCVRFWVPACAGKADIGGS